MGAVSTQIAIAAALAAFCSAARARAQADGATKASGGALIVVVRAGGLEPEELGGDTGRTPQWRRAAERGAVVAELELAPGLEPAKGGAALLVRLFDEELDAALERSRLPRLNLDATPAPLARGEDPLAPLRRELAARYGVPAAPGSDPARAERSTRVRALLEIPAPATAPAVSEPPLPVARDPGPATRALAAGVRLVLVADRARDGEDAAAALAARDAYVGALLDALGRAGQDGAPVHLAVLSAARMDGAWRASLVLAGPRVEAGWIWTRPLPWPALGPTLLELCEPELVPPARRRELPSGLLRE